MELVLSTFGANLNIENNAFIVTKGKERQRIPVDKVTNIQISKGASITSNAVLLAIENEIPVVFIDRSGNPLGRIWSPKYGSISTIRKGQLNFSLSKDAVQWIKNIIIKKIDNQQAMIMTMCYSLEDKKYVESNVHRLEVYRDKIKSLEAMSVKDVAAELRGWEGASAKIYFEALNIVLPDYLKFRERTQHPARDPVNAFLNYGYGILYGKIESALIQAGIDPYIGILHRDEYNRPVLVYDVIEIFRIWVDYIVYDLACQNVITDDYYSVAANGGIWLENLGRRIIIQSINDYFNEIIELNGLSRTRETHIQLFAQSLAQKFKKYNI